jgi:hypothetical protein
MALPVLSDLLLSTRGKGKGEREVGLSLFQLFLGERIQNFAMRQRERRERTEREKECVCVIREREKERKRKRV